MQKNSNKEKVQDILAYTMCISVFLLAIYYGYLIFLIFTIGGNSPIPKISLYIGIAIVIILSISSFFFLLTYYIEDIKEKRIKKVIKKTLTVFLTTVVCILLLI